MVSKVQFIFHMWLLQGTTISLEQNMRLLLRQSWVGLHFIYIQLKLLQTTLP